MVCSADGMVEIFLDAPAPQGWRVSLLSESLAESGGYKECILEIKGDRWDCSTAQYHTVPCYRRSFCQQPEPCTALEKCRCCKGGGPRSSLLLLGPGPPRRLFAQRTQPTLPPSRVYSKLMYEPGVLFDPWPHSAALAPSLPLLFLSRVYSKLKYESGVHRVQRVPATETQVSGLLQALHVA